MPEEPYNVGIFVCKLFSKAWEFPKIQLKSVFVTSSVSDYKGMVKELGQSKDNQRG